MRVTDGLVAGIFDASARLELRVPVTWIQVGTTVRVTSDHYRGVFEAFCGESGVALAGGYGWSDPVLTGRAGAPGEGGGHDWL